MYTPYTPEATDFYTTDYFTQYALAWLEQYEEDKRPLFLYMAYTAPHDPLMAWPDDIAKYKGAYDEGYEVIRQGRYTKQLEMGLIDETYRLSESDYPSWDSLSAELKNEETRKMEVYAAMIDRLDRNIGRLIEKLEKTGRLENTLIIFVSDNGASAEMVNIEDDSYEGGVNTPLIARWPGVIEPGSFSRFPGHFIDIMATLVDMTSVDYPAKYNGSKITPFQGETLLPAFKGLEPLRKKALYWEWTNGQAVRKEEWKLVKHGLDNEWDLYNMVKDPTETRNLAKEYPDKVRAMDQLFRDWKNSAGSSTSNSNIL